MGRVNERECLISIVEPSSAAIDIVKELDITCLCLQKCIESCEELYLFKPVRTGLRVARMKCHTIVDQLFFSVESFLKHRL